MHFPNWRKVCKEVKELNSSFTCCLTDERRPLIYAVQAECINCFMLLQSKVVVVSDEEKVVQTIRYVERS
ncbi:MAG TPA: hypothetical protein VGP55_16700 [Chitinophagaceae bacterium]|nr:hypothetical protein [Chitinophagaceae bacterium]